MKIISVLTVFGLVAACAPMDDATQGAAGPVDRCFRAFDVDNFRVESGQEAYIHARRGGVFRLDMAANCLDKTAQTLAVEPRVGTSAQMCPGDEVRLTAQLTSGPPRTCIARLTGPITDSKVSGLPG